MTETKPRLFVRSVREVGLIVVGVLIALALESAWQNASDRRQERDVLIGLLAEVDENTERVEASIATHERVDRSAADFLALLGGGGGGAAVQVPDSIIAQVIRGPTYLPVRSSLDAALSSGQIELIQSAEVQRHLAAWSQLAAEALEEESDGREFVSDVLLPHLYSTTDLTTAHRTYVESPVRSETGVLTWDSTTSAVTADGTLTNLLWRRRFYAAAATSYLVTLRDHLIETAAILREES